MTPHLYVYRCYQVWLNSEFANRLGELRIGKKLTVEGVARIPHLKWRHVPQLSSEK